VIVIIVIIVGVIITAGTATVCGAITAAGMLWIRLHSFCILFLIEGVIFTHPNERTLGELLEIAEYVANGFLCEG